MNITVSPNPSAPSSSRFVEWCFDLGEALPDSLTITEFDAADHQVTSTCQISPVGGGPMLFSGLIPSTRHYYEVCTATLTSAAGHFDGIVDVTGDICLLRSDCAENFDISVAGRREPGLVMVISEDSRLGDSRQAALVGNVFCHADAKESPIEVGDLLTTSATPGHAMKAVDRTLALGRCLGRRYVP